MTLHGRTSLIREMFGRAAMYPQFGGQILLFCFDFMTFHLHPPSQMAQVIQLWRSEKREKGQLMVEERKGESKEEKTLNMEISAMIGIGLYQLQFANNDELDITRRKMVA